MAEKFRIPFLLDDRKEDHLLSVVDRSDNAVGLTQKFQSPTEIITSSRARFRTYSCLELGRLQPT